MAQQEMMQFTELVQARRAVRVFLAEGPFDPEAVQRCLELATLSPNSSNMQLWEFYRVQDPALRQGMIPICMNQNAVRTASELVVAVIRPDRWRQHARENLENLTAENRDNPQLLAKIRRYYQVLIPLTYWQDPLGFTGALRKGLFALLGLFRPSYREAGRSDMQAVMHKSTALACMTFMLAMKAEGLDTCPLEGLDSVRARRLLKLPRAARITMVIACGRGDPQKGTWGVRHRVPHQRVIHRL
ncbi:nitroreductase family protein [Ferrimonas balearica]|uniref:nitroreductase family protein n=1 Tax=Ferrimonas balearica TaxID=44012 RepID=UPI001C999B15|nr:nitroreductase family protein [Ferrimonas balearica]MBY5992604.1 nitroreductase family protein [Ferrimonas balearica]